MELWVGCIAGALEASEFREVLEGREGAALDTCLLNAAALLLDVVAGDDDGVLVEVDDEVDELSLDELESIDYHSDNPVAVDILLIGNSVGLGGPLIGDARPVAGDNASHGCRVLCDGPVRAGLEVTVTDWQAPPGGPYDVTIEYLVYAHHDFIDARFAFEQALPTGAGFGLGVRRIPHPDAFLASAEEAILGVMGQQEGIIGRTGLGLVLDPAQFLRWDVAEGDDDAYVARLQSNNGVYRAWLVGVWEHGGIATSETFTQHLRDLAGRFAAPATVGR